jgi:hypothetical protein
MKVTTYEATVENGQIKLFDAVRLPEHATVYVVVPDMKEGAPIHFRSPRLARLECAADFKMEVTEEPTDAGLR